MGRAVRRVVLGLVGAVWAFLWRVGLVATVMLAAATGYFYSQLPPVQAMLDGRATGSVTLLDRNGSVFAWRGEQYGGALLADDVSPHLIHAMTAAEDRRFWDHWGIDPRGIARAVWANLRAGRVVQGGSTLTQQVAKNVFLDAERSFERKLKEAPMALALELKYSKEEILSIYLNRVYLGAGTYGFEAAAQRYFGKSARAVTPAEAAMLAGLLRAPSRYAPTNDIGLAQGRASVIVRAMHEEGYLSEPQVFEALANPAGLSQAAEADIGDAFADWVMETAPAYLARRTTEDVVIATTFDRKAQAAAEAGVEAVYAAKVKPGSEAQTAVVVMAPDGAVRAMVGGRKTGAGRFNRATQALRQTGSAFKPVVYAAGLMAGLTPQSVVEDAPITIRGWSPKNYGGGFRGPVTLEAALASSINTVAVRVAQRAGTDRVRALAAEMGISTPLAPGPAVALGTSEATLIDMMGVYGTIRAEGRLVEPHGLRRLTLKGDSTPLLTHTPPPAGARPLPPDIARQLIHMMHGVIEGGTGRRARLAGRQAAGKTGTTQAARDAWFIGFTADYVIGVWMGNDDNAPLTGVTGGGLPAEIWHEVALRLHDGLPPRPLPMEAGPAPQVALSGPAAERDGGVGSIFRSVLGGLGGGEGRPSEAAVSGSSTGRAFTPGNDR
ncbi:transglycosylase domain-containing protein [Paralimibaculum aggregatum]|uniref:transglycosylase domain-containing protein n=1 Tax=Paralimibaculum aggregatum TaxID=3036245 RepID=UPI0025536112|nr:PBP1A family penicillin-binding protein [Limibaculum sp. NKW23]